MLITSPRVSLGGHSEPDYREGCRCPLPAPGLLSAGGGQVGGERSAVPRGQDAPRATEQEGRAGLPQGAHLQPAAVHCAAQVPQLQVGRDRLASVGAKERLGPCQCTLKCN